MKHVTRGTLAEPLWCNKCKKFTPHKVWGTRVDKHHCLPCEEKKEAERKERLAREAATPKQEVLF